MKDGVYSDVSDSCKIHRKTLVSDCLSEKVSGLRHTTRKFMKK